MNLKSRILNYSAANAIVRDAVSSHDIIVVRLPSAAGNIALPHCVRMGKPYMVEFVACGFDALWNYNWKGKLLAPMMYLRQKRRMRNVPFVVYVTKQFLQKRYPSKGRQTNISNVELDWISEKNLDNRLERIDAWDGRRRLVLGTVAALNVPYKGQADVIKAIARLKKSGILVDYRLIGGGSPSRLLELTDRLGLQDQVKVIGAVPHAEVFRHLECIDIYVQPSRQEGLPRAVIEAMSMACPTIGAATGGIPELLSEDRIFPKRSISRIAELVKILLNKDLLMSDARRNFLEVSQYEKSALDAKRQDFYADFLDNYRLPKNNIEDNGRCSTTEDAL